MKLDKSSLSELVHDRHIDWASDLFLVANTYIWGIVA